MGSVNVVYFDDCVESRLDHGESNRKHAVDVLPLSVTQNKQSTDIVGIFVSE
ncbi:MAG: hypothetical protein ABIK07_25470 [Planctomycetota bacterium]